MKYFACPVKIWPPVTYKTFKGSSQTINVSGNGFVNTVYKKDTFWVSFLLLFKFGVYTVSMLITIKL